MSRLLQRPSIWVALVAALAFAPSLLSGFVYDDAILISRNEYVQSLEYLGRAFRTHFWNVEEFGSAGIGLVYYRPLVTASFVLNWALGGGSAWAFHLVNVLLHAACVALAVIIGERWTRSRTVAVLAALVLALHPSRTESVIWIAGRTDVMATLLLLAGVEAAARAADHSGPRRLAWSAATLLIGVAGILCKESAVLLPVLIAIEALSRERGSLRRPLWRLAIFASVIGAAYVILRAFVLPVRKGDPLELTPLHGLATVGLYAERIVFPWPQTFFFRPLESENGVTLYSMPHVIAGGLILLQLIALCVRWARPKPIAAACLAAGLVFLGPLLNFTFTGIFVTTSDHFLYLPLWLLALGLANGFQETVERWSQIRLGRLVVVGACLLWTGVAGVRALEMQNNDTLWARELEINPHNPFVLREVAIQEAALGNLDQAIALNLALLDPKSARFTTLATPGGNVEVYTRILAIDAARTPDGDVRRLRAIFRELESIAQDAVLRREPGGFRLGYEHDFAESAVRLMLETPNVKGKLAAEVALVASRLGRSADARRFLSRVRNADLKLVTNAGNVVLTHARIADWEGAERRLAWIEKQRDRRNELMDRPTLDELRARVKTAQAKFSAAADRDDPRSIVLRAAGHAETGARLRALRTLRPLYDQVGPDKLPQYVQLLVANGLLQEATSELARRVGPSAAKEQVARLSEETSRGLVQARPVQEPSPWWPPAPGEDP